MRTHLFVAPGSAAFGEVLLGLRLARELHAVGDRVMFLAPAAHRLLFEGTPFSHGSIEPITAVLDRALPDVIRARRCDTVVLLDLLLMLLVLRARNIDPSFLDRLPARTVALDIWDLRHSDLRVDMCEAELVLPDAARTLVPNRLVPVPFARPDVVGAYRALPDVSAIDDRVAARAELGLGEHDRLVMLTTAQFQVRGLTPFQTRAVATIPQQIVNACLDCDPRVRVIHVGPRALAGAPERYRYHPQVAPAQFERLMRASDLLVTPNQAATGITTALALGVLPLAVIGESTEFPFRVFPLGLHAFMSPTLLDNPYTDAVLAVDVDQLHHVVGPQLFDERVRFDRHAAMRTYVDTLRHLPSGREVLGSF